MGQDKEKVYILLEDGDPILMDPDYANYKIEDDEGVRIAISQNSDMRVSIVASKEHDVKLFHRRRVKPFAHPPIKTSVLHGVLTIKGVSVYLYIKNQNIILSCVELEP